MPVSPKAVIVSMALYFAAAIVCFVFSALTRTPRTGDQVTAWASLGHADGRAQPVQWIIRLRLAETLADADHSHASNLTLYTDTGERLTFQSEHSAMKLETLGPIQIKTIPGKPLPVKRREISAATDFLSLDLNRAAQVILRIKSAKAEPVLTPRTGQTP